MISTPLSTPREKDRIAWLIIFEKSSIEAVTIMSQAIRSLGNDHSDDEPGNTICRNFEWWWWARQYDLFLEVSKVVYCGPIWRRSSKVMVQAIRSLRNDHSDDEPGNTIFTKWSFWWWAKKFSRTRIISVPLGRVSKVLYCWRLWAENVVFTR